jgi:hypothetical protein
MEQTLTTTGDTMKYSDLTKLQRAVYRQMKADDMGEFLETLQDVANHGAGGGFNGFIYYTETVSFTKRNRAEIMEQLKEDADSYGSSVSDMVCGFNCFKGYSEDEVLTALYSGKGENVTTVYNGLAWYALETVASQLDGVTA